MSSAVDLIGDASSLYLGGAVLHRRPMALCRALAASGRRNLDLVTFAGSLDIDLLVGRGCVRSVRSAYVGLGPHGFAPHFTAASKQAGIADVEYSEWTLLQGLRAAAMGLPFLPTRAGVGSQVVEALALSRIEDPYGSGSYLAVPPMRPDVAVIHAWRASSAGDVQFGWPPEHLWDVDVLAVRSARVAIVTVEEIVASTVIAAEAHLTRLFGFEVDAVVLAPGGAWPTASPPVAEVDEAVVAAYQASGGDWALLEPGGSQ